MIMQVLLTATETVKLLANLGCQYSGHSEKVTILSHNWMRWTQSHTQDNQPSKRLIVWSRFGWHTSQTSPILTPRKRSFYQLLSSLTSWGVKYRSEQFYRMHGLRLSTTLFTNLQKTSRSGFEGDLRVSLDYSKLQIENSNLFGRMKWSFVRRFKVGSRRLERIPDPMSLRHPIH